MKTYLTTLRGNTVIATIVLCVAAFTLRVKADDLELVDPGTVTFGNFYAMTDVLATNTVPPLPWDPYPDLDLYLWSEGDSGGLPLYIYDDRSPGGGSRFHSDLDPPPDPGGGGGGDDPGVPPPPPQYWDFAGLSLLAPVFTSTNSLLLTATNTDVDDVFDVFYTTNLALLPAPALCGTNWAWLTRGAVGQFVFGVTNLPQPQCYFRLGNALYDPDGDGLSTAYELWVSHTDPNSFNSLASDGYGTPDGWYLAHNLNPQTSGIGGQDPDHDALLNSQEYLWGSDPNVSEGFAVWVASPGVFSGIP